MLLVFSNVDHIYEVLLIFCPHFEPADSVESDFQQLQLEDKSKTFDRICRLNSCKIPQNLEVRRKAQYPAPLTCWKVPICNLHLTDFAVCLISRLGGSPVTTTLFARDMSCEKRNVLIPCIKSQQLLVWDFHINYHYT